MTRPRYIADVDVVDLPLFQINPTPAYRKDRDTSVEAAKRMRDSAASIRGRVLDAIAEAGQRGMTVSELMEKLRIDERNNVAPRCSELSSEKYGRRIMDSGKRRVGRHSLEIVWIAG